MNCSACKARLGAYRDGDLSRRDAALIAAHLDSCVSCRAYEAKLARIESSLTQLARIEPANDFTLAVMAKIAAMPAPARSRTRFWWLIGIDVIVWAAVGALTALGAIRWKAVSAGVATSVAKAGITLSTLYDVGQHFHLNAIVALGVLVESIFLVVLIVAGRKYLSRLRGAASGVLS